MQVINSSTRKFKNPVTGTKHLAAEGVRQYGFSASGKIIYAEAEKDGKYIFMGYIIEVEHMVYFQNK